MIRLVLLGLAAYGAVRYVSRHARRSETHALLPAPGSPRTRLRNRRDGVGADHDRGDLDREAMRLAEETDVSPNQAREMIREQGATEAEIAARNFKAES